MASKKAARKEVATALASLIIGQGLITAGGLTAAKASKLIADVAIKSVRSLASTCSEQEAAASEQMQTSTASPNGPPSWSQPSQVGYQAPVNSGFNPHELARQSNEAIEAIKKAESPPRRISFGASGFRRRTPSGGGVYPTIEALLEDQKNII